jgi:hypothetical protein
MTRAISCKTLVGHATLLEHRRSDTQPVSIRITNARHNHALSTSYRHYDRRGAARAQVLDAAGTACLIPSRQCPRGSRKRARLCRCPVVAIVIPLSSRIQSGSNDRKDEFAQSLWQGSTYTYYRVNTHFKTLSSILIPLPHTLSPSLDAIPDIPDTRY